MEEGKSSSQSPNSSSRWNPTKEQISMLENLYKQGVRTPTAEQIQQITGKLREFGNIQGKNVFYWFQNHKARQRQKQKQQTFAYYSKLLKRSPQVLAPTAPLPQPNSLVSPPVACNGVVFFGPTMYAAPQARGLNYYPQVQTQAQHSALFNPECSKMSPAPVFPSYNLHPTQIAQTSSGCCHNYASVSNADTGAAMPETLPLFPLYPANRRCERSRGSMTLDSVSNSTDQSSVRADQEGGEEVGCENQYLFDFLGALNG